MTNKTVLPETEAAEILGAEKRMADDRMVRPFGKRGRGLSILAGLFALLGSISQAQEAGLNFMRGDANDDATVDISDAVFSLSFLFLGGPRPHCEDAADSNDDGEFDLSDAVFTLGQLFLGSDGSLSIGCSPDATEDGLVCLAYVSCKQTPPTHPRVHMTAGRESQMPVSWYYDESVSSKTGIALRTTCYGDADTGMIVLARGKVYFNDNSPFAEGNGLGSNLAFDPNPAALCKPGECWESFRVIVFSMKRATASASLLEVSRDGGESWEVQEVDNFGGTLVDVGPLLKGDSLEIQALPAGEDEVSWWEDFKTHMLLFDPTDEDRAPLDAHDGGLGGWTPRIEITTDAWCGNKNWLLIGKQTRNTSRNQGVEIRVDLVHEPLNVDHTYELGSWGLLEPGRYYAWIYAKTSAPIGHVEGYFNPANAMPPECDCPGYYRGRLDGPAFTMQVQRRSGSGQVVVSHREVRLANLGSEPGEGYNLFLSPIEVSSAGEYRLTADAVDPSVSFHGKWRAYRNPDASPLTVATYNTLYDDGHDHHNKIRNASNLLATRGAIHKHTLIVEEPPDQAPYQWSADVVALQELRRGGDDDLHERFYADLFRDEAESRGNTGWQYVWGHDEEYVGSTDGAGPLFVSSPFYPGGNFSDIYFGQDAKDAAGCEGSDDSTMQCELHTEGWSLWEQYNAIIGKISVRRFGASSDRPIVVANIHLSDGDSFEDRVNQIGDLMDILKALMKEEPRAFNVEGSALPLHYQNRIILLGDFNMSAHRCGEHYWMLRALRGQFGYACDASMAVDDWDMHDLAGSLDDWVSFEDWHDDPDAHPGYPWWLTTYRGTDADGMWRKDRFDAVMLVGKGWAYDDPVMEYEVMPDRSETNVMNPLGRGVEMWEDSDLVADGYDGDGSANGYRPNYRLNWPPELGTTAPWNPGEPALDSDHVPVRARLRVFYR